MSKASPSATKKIRTNPCATARWKACASSGTCSPAAMAKPGRTVASTTRKAARPTRAALPWKETAYSNSAASSAPPCSAAPPPGPAPNKPLRQGLFVGAPPRCEPVRYAFAPGAGAPTVRGGDRFICRSTGPGANRPGTHSHPEGAPTIRGGSGLSVGAPPDRRTARCEPAHHTFAPRGCSYNTRWAGLSVGAPPDRRTAPVRTGPAHIRTRGQYYFNRHPNHTINTAKLKYATAQLPADKLNNTGLANGVSPAMNRHTTATAINPTVHSTHPVTGGVLKPRWKYNRSITLVDSVPRPPTVIRCSAETAGRCPTKASPVARLPNASHRYPIPKPSRSGRLPQRHSCQRIFLTSRTMPAASSAPPARG